MKFNVSFFPPPLFPTLLRFCISFLRSSGIEIRCCLAAWPAKTAGCTWNKRLEGGWNRGAAGKYARDKCAALCIYILPGRFMVERKQKYTRHTLAGMVEHSASFAWFSGCVFSLGFFYYTVIDGLIFRISRFFSLVKREIVARMIHEKGIQEEPLMLCAKFVVTSCLLDPNFW